MGDPSASADPAAARHHLSPQLAGQPPVPRSPAPLDLASAAAASGHRRLSPSLRPPAHPQARLPSPYGQISSPGAAAHHALSLSQPLFFSLDSLPPPPPPYADLGAAPAVPAPSPPPSTSDPPPPLGLPPRRSGHRRSQSDIPFGLAQLSPPLPPPAPVKREVATAAEGGDGDDAAFFDLVNAYMDLDGLDPLNSSEDRHDDRDSRASGTTRAGSAAESSENEAESQSTSADRKDGGKSRHCRSLSMDSFMGKLNFAAGDESPKLPLPSPRASGSLTRSGSGSLEGGAVALFDMEFSNGEFTESEKKKIMANERLAEIALTDPKRVKRILANRQSAARSKERKMRYIQELEHKVQVLQTEATTLSAQLTMLQRDSAGLATQNNELKIRLQAMEQQAQLRDALNEALTGEVQRLKLATGEMTDGPMPKGLQQQMNSQMLQLQQLQIQQQAPPQQTQQQGQRQQPQKSA
ncbi:Transcription factor RF2b [Zea mays]|uniref:Transcription factor RF2b n=2 Tax=Zea mays TaxID=4577 RepID=A0A8J8XUS4_MAIZE|nr:Putative bZIP transcription factor superfamily protein [Zea mays]PWZ27658.1 Transcription factor RF2b [Zea mays]